MSGNQQKHFRVSIALSEEKNGLFESEASIRRWTFMDDEPPFVVSGPQQSRSEQRAISYALTELAAKIDSLPEGTV